MLPSIPRSSTPKPKAARTTAAHFQELDPETELGICGGSVLGGVSGLQTPGYLDEVVECFVDGNGTLSDAVGQRLATDQLHNEEVRLTVALEAMESRNVGMVQRGEDLCFPLEAGQAFRMGGYCFQQNLDGDIPPELGVPRAVDFSHPTRAEWGEDFVVT